MFCSKFKGIKKNNVNLLERNDIKSCAYKDDWTCKPSVAAIHSFIHVFRSLAGIFHYRSDAAAKRLSPQNVDLVTNAATAQLMHNRLMILIFFVFLITERSNYKIEN